MHLLLTTVCVIPAIMMCLQIKQKSGGLGRSQTILGQSRKVVLISHAVVSFHSLTRN